MDRFIFAFVTLLASLELFSPPSTRAEDLTVLFVASFKPACDVLIPGYQTENRVNYTAWRSEHQSDIELAESLPELQNKPEEIASKLGSLSAEERRKIEKYYYRLADVL